MSSNPLFSPLKVGANELKHRIALAPLTRFRAHKSHVHSDLAIEYYSQRASFPGTLLTTEATSISSAAGGYNNVPGIWSEEQVAAWKKIVDGVHKKDSFLYLQLWALGRAADPGVLEADGHKDGFVSSGDVPLGDGPKPRPLTQTEIKQYIKDYAEGARRFVKEAGGDGVEIHGANGYLVDQFTQNTSNNRTDEYGGSVENRARFALEVIDAVVGAVGAERTGIRLSPYSKFQGMRMKKTDIEETFTYLVSQIVQKHPNLAYIHVVNPRISGSSEGDTEDSTDSLDSLHKIWSPRPFLIAGGIEPKDADSIAKKYNNSVVVFGRYFISNPDLVARIKFDRPIAPYDRSTFYVPGPDKFEGYTDQAFDEEIKGKY